MNHANLKQFFSTLQMFFGVLLMAAGWSQDAWALDMDTERGRCPDAIVKSVGKFFRLDHFAYPKDYFPSIENGGLIVAGVCKPMPDDASRVIAAFAYDAGVEYEKKLLLVVYDDMRKRVISSYSETIDEDAGTEVTPYSIVIDTARYVLAENTRAFGLRLNISSGRGCGDGTWGDELTLYVMEGRELRPVFSATMRLGLLGRIDSVEGGDRCGFNMKMNSEKIISIEKTATHGFADIRLTAKITWDADFLDEVSATQPNPPKPLSRIIKYDGKRHVYDDHSALNADIYDAMDKLFQKIKEIHGGEQKEPGLR